MESDDTPVFVSEAVVALIDSVSKTTQLANLKYETLKVILNVIIVHSGTIHSV